MSATEPRLTDAEVGQTRQARRDQALAEQAAKRRERERREALRQTLEGIPDQKLAKAAKGGPIPRKLARAPSTEELQPGINPADARQAARAYLAEKRTEPAAPARPRSPAGQLLTWLAANPGAWVAAGGLLGLLLLAGGGGSAPSPRSGEDREAFMSRCLSDTGGDMAKCSSRWDG